jgi:hypothetical protein
MEDGLELLGWFVETQEVFLFALLYYADEGLFVMHDAHVSDIQVWQLYLYGWHHKPKLALTKSHPQHHYLGPYTKEHNRIHIRPNKLRTHPRILHTFLLSRHFLIHRRQILRSPNNIRYHQIPILR